MKVLEAVIILKHPLQVVSQNASSRLNSWQWYTAIHATR